jgi:predicted ribosomally synthesized peptide with nif11-like leader
VSSDALKALIARANNDKDFLRLLLTDPISAAKQGGYELTEQELEAIKNSQPTQITDEELEKRISKGIFRLG